MKRDPRSLMRRLAWAWALVALFALANVIDRVFEDNAVMAGVNGITFACAVLLASWYWHDSREGQS